MSRKIQNSLAVTAIPHFDRASYLNTHCAYRSRRLQFACLISVSGGELRLAASKKIDFAPLAMGECGKSLLCRFRDLGHTPRGILNSCRDESPIGTVTDRQDHASQAAYAINHIIKQSTSWKGWH